MVEEAVDIEQIVGVVDILDFSIIQMRNLTGKPIQTPPVNKISIINTSSFWSCFCVERGYHCFVTNWFDEGVYDFGKGFSGNACSTNNSRIPIHTLFPCKTGFLHCWHTCSRGTSILQILFRTNRHFLQYFCPSAHTTKTSYRQNILLL